MLVVWQIDILLEGFRIDTGLTHEQIIQAMKDLNSKPDLRDIFQVHFSNIFNPFNQFLKSQDFLSSPFYL